MDFNQSHKSQVEERGYGYLLTYNSKEITIDKKNKKQNKVFIRVICPYCQKEYDVRFDDFIKNKQNCNHCCNKYENSFAYHIEKELNEPLDKYWDWDKNATNPYLIYKNRSCKSKSGDNWKVWIKCHKTDYHDSYEISCNKFIRGDRCPYCSTRQGRVHPRDSFAQYHIDNTDKDFLTKYWSDKNIVDPWEITPCSLNKVIIICQDVNYHDDYTITCDRFTRGDRCNYCNHSNSGKIHKFDSFGYKYPKYVEQWNHIKNNESPFKVSPYAHKKFYFNCIKCKEPFHRRLDKIRSDTSGVVCPQCKSSMGEISIIMTFKKFNINYISQKQFKNLLGLGGGNLSYDFYLPEYNLLIEFQGRQHEEYADMFHSTEEDFKKQIEHDRRKFNYAISNNINILYIYHWQLDEIEEILKYELQLIDLGGVI